MDHGLPGAALFCLAMALGATVVALVPRWRKSWGWGRSGEAGPISGVGWAGVVLAFLLIAAGVGTANRGGGDPFFTLVLVLGGFALFIAAGAFDSVRNSRGRKRRK